MVNPNQFPLWSKPFTQDEVSTSGDIAHHLARTAPIKALKAYSHNLRVQKHLQLSDEEARDLGYSPTIEDLAAATDPEKVKRIEELLDTRYDTVKNAGALLVSEDLADDNHGWPTNEESELGKSAIKHIQEKHLRQK